MQQFLYFFPLPQGQGSLRPTRCGRDCGSARSSGRRFASRRSPICCCRAISPRPTGFFVSRRGFLPGRADETSDLLFHPEDQIGDPFADRSSTSSRTSAFLRACTRPSDRSGHSRAGRPPTADGPCQQMVFPGRVEHFAAPATAPSAASRGGSGFRRSPTSDLLELLAIERRRTSLGQRFSMPLLSRQPCRQPARAGPPRLAPCFASNASSGSSLTSAGARPAASSAHDCSPRLCSIKQVANLVALLALEIFEVEIDLESLVGPVRRALRDRTASGRLLSRT